MGNNDKVTICHRTNAIKNPYVQIEIDTSAADGSGGNGDHFNEHTGPVFDPAVHTANSDDWGDIIPPIDGSHSGLNWDDEGQAIYNNGCKLSPTGDCRLSTTCGSSGTTVKSGDDACFYKIQSM